MTFYYIVYLGSRGAVLASFSIVVDLNSLNLLVLAEIEAVDVLIGGRSLSESLSS